MTIHSATFQPDMPLTLPLNMLTKRYVGVMFRTLAHVGIEKYYTAMLVIGKAGGNLNQQTLADELHIDKATVVRMVDYLADREFIVRKQNPDDRREYFLVLTPKACEAMQEISATISQLNEVIFSNFSGKPFPASTKLSLRCRPTRCCLTMTRRRTDRRPETSGKQAMTGNKPYFILFMS
jgi:DNA-binding MarR family transcriptional regulator